MTTQNPQNRTEVKKVKFHHKVRNFYYKNLFRKIYTVAIIGLIGANVFSLVKYQSFADESLVNETLTQSQKEVVVTMGPTDENNSPDEDVLGSLIERETFNEEDITSLRGEEDYVSGEKIDISSTQNDEENIQVLTPKKSDSENLSVASLDEPDITYYNVAGEEKAIMAYNLGATSTDIDDEDSFGNEYSWGIKEQCNGSYDYVDGCNYWENYDAGEYRWDERAQGLCPAGYHVPTMNEWINLFVQWCENDKICDTKDLDYYVIDEYDGINFRNNLNSGFLHEFYLPTLMYHSSTPVQHEVIWNFSTSSYIESWWNEDIGPIIARALRCFKDSTNDDPIPLALDIYVDGELADRIFVPAGQNLSDSKISKLSKYDLYDRDDEKINLNSVIFTEDDSDEGIIELYAECAQGYHEANGKCISDDAGVYYEDGYIVITDGETTSYVKDRNQGAEISLKILYDEYGIDEEDYGYEFNIMKNDEDYVKTFGNWYFWGNNSGVSYSDFFGSGGMVSLEDLAQKGFDGGRIGDNDTGWEEGATNNPCKADDGEYLPTLSDYLTAMNVWGNVKGRDNLFYTDGNSYEMYNGEGFFDDILLPQGATQMRTDSYGYYSFGDVSSMQTAKDSGGYSWMLTSSEGQHYIEYGVDYRAMPVRCFIRPEYIDGNSYEVKFMDGDKELFTKKVLPGRFIKNIEEQEKKGYIFAGWYRDSEFQNEFDIDNTPITGNISLYAKWKEYGVIYGSGYIKITNGDEWVYIKDKNQGVSGDFIDKVNQIHALQNDMCEQVREDDVYALDLNINGAGHWTTICEDNYYTQVGEMIGVEDPDNREIEDYIAYNSIGNFYFRGNNTGVNYFDLELDGDNVENYNDLVALGFTGGIQTEDGKGWTINPCNGENEYLPSVADWAKAINIRSDLNENGTRGEDDSYGGYIGFDRKFLDDIMIYGGGRIRSDYGDSEYRFWLFGYDDWLWADVSDNLVGRLYRGGSLLYDKIGGNYEFNVSEANPIRCFLNITESDDEEEEVTPPTPTSSYGGGGGGGRRINKDNKKDEDKAEEESKNQNETTVSEESSTNPQGHGSAPQIDIELDIQKYNATYSPEQNTAYQFAYAHGITTKPTIQEAKMGTPLTRIQMARMLSYYAINVLGKTPDYSRGMIQFNDVSNKLNKEYNNGVTLAYQLGIMGINMKSNNFRPNDIVTRAEFATALSRMLYGLEDGTGKIKYYEPHIAKLYNEGIINKADPKLVEKKGYAMLMLMRTVE